MEKIKKAKKWLLRILVAINVVVFVIAAAALDGETSFVAYLLCGITMTFLWFVIYVNFIRRRKHE